MFARWRHHRLINRLHFLMRFPFRVFFFANFDVVFFIIYFHFWRCTPYWTCMSLNWVCFGPNLLISLFHNRIYALHWGSNDGGWNMVQQHPLLIIATIFGVVFVLFLWLLNGSQQTLLFLFFLFCFVFKSNAEQWHTQSVMMNVKMCGWCGMWDHFCTDWIFKASEQEVKHTAFAHFDV